MKIHYLIALMICFNFVACKTTEVNNPEWPNPPKPQIEKLDEPFEEVDGGYFISTDDAKVIVNNVDELKAYIKKLEALIEAMRKYYCE